MIILMIVILLISASSILSLLDNHTSPSLNDNNAFDCVSATKILHYYLNIQYRLF